MGLFKKKLVEMKCKFVFVIKMMVEDLEAKKLIAETPLHEYIISRVKLLGGMKKEC